jgi:hypothetical protein
MRVNTPLLAQTTHNSPHGSHDIHKHAHPCPPTQKKSEGGLDDKVEEIIKEARKHGIPVVFALSRSRLGKALGKSMRMSAAYDPPPHPQPTRRLALSLSLSLALLPAPSSPVQGDTCKCLLGTADASAESPCKHIVNTRLCLPLLLYSKHNTCAAHAHAHILM